jgi:hypothetical protein
MVVGEINGEELQWCWEISRKEAGRTTVMLINDYLLLESAARKVATGLAYLLLTWSTVVLLGGFVSVLKLIDFWCLAAISTSFAVK